jgi:hypothetical protein
MKQIQLNLPSNITNSDSYSCYIILVPLKFIGEHNYVQNFKFYLNDILLKYCTHTHTHYKFYIVRRFTNVITMNEQLQLNF